MMKSISSNMFLPSLLPPMASLTRTSSNVSVGRFRQLKLGVSMVSKSWCSSCSLLLFLTPDYWLEIRHPVVYWLISLQGKHTLGSILTLDRYIRPRTYRKDASFWRYWHYPLHSQEGRLGFEMDLRQAVHLWRTFDCFCCCWRHFFLWFVLLPLFKYSAPLNSMYADIGNLTLRLICFDLLAQEARSDARIDFLQRVDFSWRGPPHGLCLSAFLSPRTKTAPRHRPSYHRPSCWDWKGILIRCFALQAHWYECWSHVPVSSSFFMVFSQLHLEICTDVMHDYATYTVSFPKVHWVCGR